MFNRPCVNAAFLAVLALSPVSPTLAADGQVVITHAKALNGNVVPGDAAGYPVTLSQAGSYVLGGNLAPGPDAIEVTTSDVSIDLNGFKISGGRQQQCPLRHLGSGRSSYRKKWNDHRIQ